MNAIAQGFLADTVAGRLRSAGVKSALLQLGESYAIGRHPEGRRWRLAIMGTPVNGETDLVGNVEFSDAGLAVSANDATRIVIDPVANTVRRQARVAAVVSREGAAVADAYATAFAAAPEQRWPDLGRTLNNVPGSQVHIWVENEPRFSQPP
jgi:thiamine biosynthesis lipoprotein